MGQLLEVQVLLVVLASFVHAEASSMAALFFFSLVAALVSRLSCLLLSTRLSMPDLLVGGSCGWRVTQLTWWFCFVYALVESLGRGALFERVVQVILLE